MGIVMLKMLRQPQQWRRRRRLPAVAILRVIFVGLGILLGPPAIGAVEQLAM